jgi:hypothetical protein
VSYAPTFNNPGDLKMTTAYEKQEELNLTARELAYNNENGISHERIYHFIEGKITGDIESDRKNKLLCGMEREKCGLHTLHSSTHKKGNVNCRKCMDILYNEFK